jgi:hypothetical protein
MAMATQRVEVMKMHVETHVTPILIFLVGLFLIQFSAISFGYAGSVFHTDPPAVVIFSSPELTIVREELGGFSNYGVTDSAADVLYSSEFDQWNFDLSTVHLPGPIQSAKVFISLVLEDHYDRSESDYIGRVSVNGGQVFSNGWSTALGVHHGVPFGEIFQNWKVVSFTIENLVASIYVINIENNTSGAVFRNYLNHQEVALCAVSKSRHRLVAVGLRN